MLSPRAPFASFLISCLLLLGSAAAQAQFGWLRGTGSDFKTYGRITVFHLDVPLNAPGVASLEAFPLQDFTYVLYPTAGSGAEGMIPGNTETGAPISIPVVRGIYDHRNDPTNPIEFEAIKADPEKLPKAPGGEALLVYSVLYSGKDLANCTGVVQVLERDQSKLMLADQFSYDCRGGAGAEWSAQKRQLTIRSARYSLGDKPCCPSQYDSVVFKLDGKSVKTGDVSINNQ
ncbi:MAG TPA: hypothetical protein VN690_12635 [Terriglobales bacterium]|nr:hypothetical protein [Terriglobales bacterium]